MSIRLQISILIFLMVQATLFGVGTVLVLATPLSAVAMALMPWVIGVSAVFFAPVAWAVAPRFRGRFQRQIARPFHPAE